MKVWIVREGYYADFVSLFSTEAKAQAYVEWSRARPAFGDRSTIPAHR